MCQLREIEKKRKGKASMQQPGKRHALSQKVGCLLLSSAMHGQPLLPLKALLRAAQQHAAQRLRLLLQQLEHTGPAAG